MKGTLTYQKQKLYCQVIRLSWFHYRNQPVQQEPPPGVSSGSMEVLPQVNGGKVAYSLVSVSLQLPKSETFCFPQHAPYTIACKLRKYLFKLGGQAHLQRTFFHLFHKTETLGQRNLSALDLEFFLLKNPSTVIVKDKQKSYTYLWKNHSHVEYVTS